MKNIVVTFFIWGSLFLIATPSAFSASNSKLVNRIEGQVYDQQRNPIYNAFVELYNDVNSLIGRTRTSSSGRFFFVGMNAGHYTIKILPLATNFLSDSQEIEVVNQNARSDLVMVEFTLRIDKKAADRMQNLSGEAIFVQDIPADAKKLYEKAVNSLKNGGDQGIAELEASIKIFPTYFDALSRLGRERVSRGNYEEGYKNLVAAVDVNQRSYSCYYSLAYAFYKLGEIPAAVKAANAAVILNPSSDTIQLLTGTVLRLNGDLKAAEKALTKARELAASPNPEIHWQLSLLYNKLNKNEAAAKQLEIYLKLSPNSPETKKIQDLIIKLRSSKQS